MKIIALVAFLALSSVHLMGYNLIPSDQLEGDGRRLLNPKHLTELEQILSQLRDNNTTASGWPITIPFYEALIPLGGPRWEKPAKINRLCNRYYERFGDTTEYQRLRVNYLLMIAQRAIRRGLDGDIKIDDREAFIVPYVEEADQILEAFSSDERDSLWYIQKGRVLSFKDGDLTDWLSSVRRIYPGHPNLLLALIYEEEMDVGAIELEIAKRNLTPDAANILYAQIISYLLRNNYSNQDNFSQTVDWERHMDGLAQRHQRYPTDYIYDEEHKLQIIGKYKGGMNHKTRDWAIVDPGHVKITNLTNNRSWSQTMFCDGKALVVQHLAAPYGTSYFEYIGSVEEALPEINEAYYKFNPSKTHSQPTK